MPLRPCLGLPGKHCGRLTPRADSRCPGCSAVRQRARDARRGSARQRGYDSDHEATRDRLLPLAYGKPCPRCGRLMLRGQALDLGHSVARSRDPAARGDRIEHALCNRSAGADAESRHIA